MLDLVLGFVHVPAVHAGDAAQFCYGLVEAVGQGAAAGGQVIAAGAAQGPVGAGAGARGLFQHPLQITVVAIVVGGAAGTGFVVAAHQ